MKSEIKSIKRGGSETAPFSLLQDIIYYLSAFFKIIRHNTYRPHSAIYISSTVFISNSVSIIFPSFQQYEISYRP